MRRLVGVAIVVLLVALAVYYVAVELPGAVDREASSTGDVLGDPATASGIVRPAGATLSHVAYVHDGDTLYLQPAGTTTRAEEITVRLIGIDTPELRPEVECFALEARDRLRALLPEGAEVWTMADAQELDQYGRSLLYLWTTSGVSVNLDLVENGYASALRIAPSDTYWREFAAAETAAMAADRGMWGQC